MKVLYEWRVKDRSIRKLIWSKLSGYVPPLKKLHEKILRRKGMRKLTVFAMLVVVGCFGNGAVRGQVIGTANEPEVRTSLFDFGTFFSSVRAGYAINQHLERSEVFYTAIQSFHNTAGVEFANINAGYDGAKKRPLIAVGGRLDNIIPMIWGSQWGKAHVTTAKLPTVEFGPYTSFWPIKTRNGYRLDMYCGLMTAIGFK